MRAEFRIAGDYTVVVESLPGGSVEIRSMEGFDAETSIEVSEKIKRHSIVLSKQQARAVASTMMGCASEA